MSKRILLALGLAGMAATMAAQADDQVVDDRWYVAPFGTWYNPGGDRDASDSWGGGLSIGKMINEYFNVEIKGIWNPLRGHGYRGDIIGGTIDLQYYFMRDAFSPYVVAGIGGVNTSLRSSGFSDEEASFIFETGVGATYELHDNFLLRGDVRYRLDTLPSSLNASDEDVLHDMTVNFGFVVPFGPKPQPLAQAEPVAAPADDCAARDTDRDGVNDCDDKCPGTMSGSKVDDQGCPIRIELRGVNFKYNSDELTPTAQTILDQAAEQLIAFPEQKDIEVAGHASSEGTNAYNLKLSQRRSASVARYLKAKGVPNKLYPKGYGEEFPIADNNTEEGRSKNRRVELVWMGD
jgi:OOP family OmpA-OmpF porin